MGVLPPIPADEDKKEDKREDSRKLNTKSQCAREEAREAAMATSGAALPARNAGYKEEYKTLSAEELAERVSKRTEGLRAWRANSTHFSDDMPQREFAPATGSRRASVHAREKAKAHREEP